MKLPVLSPPLYVVLSPRGKGPVLTPASPDWHSELNCRRVAHTSAHSLAQSSFSWWTSEEPDRRSSGRVESLSVPPTQGRPPPQMEIRSALPKWHLWGVTWRCGTLETKQKRGRCSTSKSAPRFVKCPKSKWGICFIKATAKVQVWYFHMPQMTALLQFFNDAVKIEALPIRMEVESMDDFNLRTPPQDLQQRGSGEAIWDVTIPFMFGEVNNFEHLQVWMDSKLEVSI